MPILENGISVSPIYEYFLAEKYLELEFEPTAFVDYDRTIVLAFDSINELPRIIFDYLFYMATARRYEILLDSGAFNNELVFENTIKNEFARLKEIYGVSQVKEIECTLKFYNTEAPIDRVLKSKALQDCIAETD